MACHLHSNSLFTRFIAKWLCTGVFCVIALASYAQDDIYVKPTPKTKQFKSERPKAIKPIVASKDESAWHIYGTGRAAYMNTNYSYDKAAFTLGNNFVGANFFTGHVGILVEKGQSFGFQAEVGNMTLGSSFSFTNRGIGTNPDTSYKLTYKVYYTSLPILFRYNLFQDKDNQFCVQLIIGPEFNFLNRGSLDVDIAAGPRRSSGSFNINSEYKPTLINGMLGASIRVRLVPEFYLVFQATGHTNLNYLGNELLPVVSAGRPVDIPISVTSYSLSVGLMYRIY